jgi:CheY-like chemotaxis protein
MPGLDGWQTLAELRKIDPDIPVIMASGYDQSMVMRGEHADQPQAFISKPYNSRSLQQAIKQVSSPA